MLALGKNEVYFLPCIQVLKDSGVFEYNWTELELWLDQLARVEPDQQEIVIHFLERVRWFKSQYSYLLQLVKRNTKSGIIPQELCWTINCWSLTLGVGETGVQLLHVHR